MLLSSICLQLRSTEIPFQHYKSTHALLLIVLLLVPSTVAGPHFTVEHRGWVRRGSSKGNGSRTREKKADLITADLS